MNRPPAPNLWRVARASVFLIPVVLLLAVRSGRADDGPTQPPPSESAWQARLEAAEEGADPAAAATARRALARIHMARGGYAEALRLLRPALEATEPACEATSCSATLALLGLVHYGLGDPRRAITFLERASQLRLKQPDPRGAAACLADTGMMHLALGEPARALEVLESALAIQEEHADRAQQCRTLTKLADAQVRLGAHDTAAASLKRALRLARLLGRADDESAILEAQAAAAWRRGHHALALRRLDDARLLTQRSGDRRRQASVLRHTAGLLADLGRIEDATRRLDDARALIAALGDHAAECATLRQSGALASRAGRFEEAQALLNECLRCAGRLGDPLELTLVHGELGSLYLRHREIPRARHHYERSLVSARAHGDGIQEAVTLGNLGELWRTAGDLAKAEHHQRAALAKAIRVGRVRTIALCRWGLARTLLDLDRADAALALVRSAQVDILPPLARLHETLGPDAYEIWSGLQEVGVLAALKLDDASALFELIEAQRARSLFATLTFDRHATSKKPPESLVLAEARARGRKQRAAAALERLVRARALRSDRRAGRKRLAEADAALADVRRRIVRRRSHSRIAQPAPLVSLADCRAGLGATEVAVLYAFAGSEAHALVVSSGGARVVGLGAAKSIRHLCRPGLDERLADPIQARALRARLLDALALPRTVGHLVLCPQAELWDVPYSLLVDRAAVTHAPSISTYLHLKERADGKSRDVLALGDPAYDSRSVFGGAVGRSLPALPASRPEVVAVGTHRLLGEHATRSSLLARLTRRPVWRAVHLACHGLADADRPLQSALALAPGKDHDGIVTALNVLGMRVPADLVVLSGCRTGQGRVYRSEGMVGLARAFLCAGAKRVLCSLWRVDDEATSALMIRFYELWNPADGVGRSATEALRLAQDHVRKNPRWQAPRYWAGWALWGPP